MEGGCTSFRKECHFFLIDHTNTATIQSYGVVKGKPRFCHRLLWKRALQDSDRPSKGFELASIGRLKDIASKTTFRSSICTLGEE